MTVKETNGLYLSEGLTIRPKFVDRVVRMFGSRVQDLDFTQPERAAATINGHVERDTAGHITDLVDPGGWSWPGGTWWVELAWWISVGGADLIKWEDGCRWVLLIPFLITLKFALEWFCYWRVIRRHKSTVTNSITKTFQPMLV